MNAHPDASDLEPTSVLLVDDHPAILEALSAAIDESVGLRVVGATETADELLAMLQQETAAIIVVDITLRDADGLGLVRRVRAAAPEVRIVVFSMHDENAYAEQAVRAGASAYVMKSEPSQTVVAAIQAVAEGEIYLSRHITSRMLGKAIRDPGYQIGSEIDRLTDRERTVFQYLGSGRSVTEIAAELGLNRKTVETYRRRAKEKLSLETVAELLHYATQWARDERDRQHACIANKHRG